MSGRTQPNSETAPEERRGTYTLIKVTELASLKARIQELEAALQPFLAVANVMEFYTEESMPEMTYPRPECESRYPDEPRCVTLTQADFARIAALQPKSAK